MRRTQLLKHSDINNTLLCQISNLWTPQRIYKWLFTVYPQLTKLQHLCRLCAGKVDVCQPFLSLCIVAHTRNYVITVGACRRDRVCGASFTTLMSWRQQSISTDISMTLQWWSMEISRCSCRESEETRHSAGNNGKTSVTGLSRQRNTQNRSGGENKARPKMLTFLGGVVVFSSEATPTILEMSVNMTGQGLMLTCWCMQWTILQTYQWIKSKTNCTRLDKYETMSKLCPCSLYSIHLIRLIQLLKF